MTPELNLKEREDKSGGEGEDSVIKGIEAGNRILKCEKPPFLM